MKHTKVKQLMRKRPSMIRADATLQDAAKMMRSIDCGVLPVGTQANLEGIITDRDIVIRAIAEGVDPTQEKVGDHMSDRVYCCNENNTLTEAADLMRKHQISRLIVEDEDGKMTGILSFGCILRKNCYADEIADVVEHAVRNRAA